MSTDNRAQVVFGLVAVISRRDQRGVIRHSLSGFQPGVKAEAQSDTVVAIRGWDGLPFDVTENQLPLFAKTGAYYVLDIEFTRYGQRVTGATYLEEIQAPEVAAVGASR